MKDDFKRGFIWTILQLFFVIGLIVSCLALNGVLSSSVWSSIQLLLAD